MTPAAPAPDAAPAPVDGSSYTMAAAAAHQVRGPLSSVRLRLELLQDRLRDASHAAEQLEVRGILHEVARLSEVLEQVLAWGSVDPDAEAPVEEVDTLGVTAARVDAWCALAAAQGARLSLEGVAVVATQVRGCLEQTLDVLLDNALHVTPEGGEVLVTVASDAARVRVEVCDQGPGMTEAEIAQARTPFWRGRAGRHRKDTGLGLTIAADLLAASGGRLELGPADTGGLRAVAVLPSAE